MSDMAKRLRASVSIGAINGDAFERGICGKQMLEAANAIESLQRQVAEQRSTIIALMTGVQEHTGKEGTTPVLRYICELEAKLKTIAEMTDGDNADSYRADDREGCLDAVHAIATEAALNTEHTG